MEAILAADRAAAGRGIPDVCSRHGQKATHHEKVTFASRPPGWSYVLLLLGLLPFIIVLLSTRRKVTVAAWPFCDECKATRQKRTNLELGFMALFAVCLIGSFVVDGVATVRWLALAAIFAAIAALLVNRMGSLGVIAGAQVTRDGASLRVPNAAEPFQQQAAKRSATP